MHGLRRRLAACCCLGEIAMQIQSVTLVAAAAGAPVAQSDAPFQPSTTFEGARPGCFFGMGDKGLGYYRDTPMVRGADAACVCWCKSTLVFTLTEQQLVRTQLLHPCRSSAWRSQRTLTQQRHRQGRLRLPARRPHSMRHRLARPAARA